MLGFRASVLALLVACGLSTTGAAADFPVRPIKLVVPFAAGGSTDLTARVIAQKLSEKIGQSVLIDNRPGGGTTIGAMAVIGATPDGYTLLYAGPPAVLAPYLTKGTTFNITKDFAPVVMTTSSSLIIVASTKYPPKTIGEVIADAKARPGKVNMGMAGYGSTGHLTAALFAKLAQVDMTFVPFPGNAPALTSVAGDEIQLTVDSFVSSMSFIDAGKIRVLAVTTLARSPLYPDIPTVAESGLPGFDVAGWNGIFAPLGTPADVIEKLNNETNAALTSADLKAQLVKMDYVPVGGDVKKMREFAVSEDKRWSVFIKEAGFQAQ